MNRSMMELTDALEKEFDNLVKYCMISGEFDPEFYKEYDVKRGLRDANGKGVLTGLTEISDVVSYDIVDGKKVPAPGRLYYQGYNVEDILDNAGEKRYLFEEVTYLLLFGELPNKPQMMSFVDILTSLQGRNPESSK